jgi:hypothetical protein
MAEHNADRSNEPSRPAPAPADTFECAMCRLRAPIRQTVMMSGRRLCFGCASGWFEDEDD